MWVLLVLLAPATGIQQLVAISCWTKGWFHCTRMVHLGWWNSVKFYCLDVMRNRWEWVKRHSSFTTIWWSSYAMIGLNVTEFSPHWTLLPFFWHVNNISPAGIIDRVLFSLLIIRAFMLTRTWVQGTPLSCQNSTFSERTQCCSFVHSISALGRF